MNRTLKLIWLALAVLSLQASPLYAQTPQSQSPEDQASNQKGRAIFDEADRRNDGYGDSQADMLMILKNKRENTSEREMNVQSLEGVNGEGDKTLMVFLSPRDQRGTALLTYQHQDRDDDQWLYLPALKRVKKIASSKKSGPFMGSEFSFEDIGGQQIDDYTYRYLRDESLNGQDCFVVESTPKDKNSGYSKIVTWVDKEHYRTLKADFYDRKQSHLKTLEARDFTLYQERFWRPHEVEMVNHRTGRSTVLKQSNIQFNVGLSENDFTQNSLKRAR